MYNFKKRQYNLLLIAAIPPSVLAIIIFDSPIHFELFGKLYSVLLANLLWLISINLLLSWLLYMVTNRMLFSTLLIKFHIIFTVSLSLILMVTPFIFTYSSPPRSYYDYGDFVNRFKIFNDMSPVISVMLVLLILGQLTFLINLYVGIGNKEGFAKKNNKNKSAN